MPFTASRLNLPSVASLNNVDVLGGRYVRLTGITPPAPLKSLAASPMRGSPPSVTPFGHMWDHLNFLASLKPISKHAIRMSCWPASLCAKELVRQGALQKGGEPRSQSTIASAPGLLASLNRHWFSMWRSQQAGATGPAFVTWRGSHPSERGNLHSTWRRPPRVSRPSGEGERLLTSPLKRKGA